jgi:catalase
MAARSGASIKTRKVAILVGDGVEAPPFRRFLQDLTEAGAICSLVGTQLGTVSTTSGKQLVVDHTFATMPSVMFDAVLIPGGNSSVATLCGSGEAVHFVLEAYKHCKTICAVSEGVQLLSTLGFSQAINPGLAAMATSGILIANARQVLEGQVTQDFIAAIALHRHWDRLNVDAVPA